MYVSIKKEVCNKMTANNSLLEKYLLHGTKKNNKIIDNSLAVYLLESKIQFKHRLGGLHRLLIIIKEVFHN